MRLPPIEARALRRKVAAEAGFPDADDDDDAVARAVGDVPSAVVQREDARSDATPIAGPPIGSAHPEVPRADLREVLPTVRVQPVPFEPPGAAAPVARPVPSRSRLHRPPLPMPDVLRAGPRPATPRSASSSTPVATTSAAAPWPAVPEMVTEIDTASLVLEVAASLTASEPDATAVAKSPPPVTTDVVATAEGPDDHSTELTLVHTATAVAARAVAGPPAEAAVEAESVGQTEVRSIATPSHTAVQAAPTFAADPVELASPRRPERSAARARDGHARRGWVVAIGLAASVAAGVWWFVPRTMVGAATTAAASIASVAAAARPAHGPTAAALPAEAPDEALPDEALPAGSVALEERPVDTMLAAAPSMEAAPPVAPPSPADVAALLALLPVDAATPVDAVTEDASPSSVESKPAPVAARGPAKPRTGNAAAKPKPTGSAAPTPVASAPPPKPPAPPASRPAPALDATALLRDAEAAFADGRFGTALRNAQRSLADRHDPRAVRIAILSACKLKREDVARAQISRLPFGQRRGVRSTCKDSGVDI